MTNPAQGNPLARFSSGFFAPFQAGRFLLRNPGLIRYVLIPFLINTLVFCLAVYFGLDFFNDVVIDQLPQGDQWYWLVLHYFLWLVAVVITAVLVFFSFTVVGNLVASPFNDLLSERTEQVLVSSGQEEPFSWGKFLRDSGRTLIEETKKMGVFLLGMGLILLLNFIPGIGSLAYAVLSILFTLFFLAIEYTGFVFSRKGATFREQRRYVFGHLVLMAGFSLGVLLLLAIPFLQFFCIPLAVVGATRIWHSTQSARENRA